MIGVVIFSAMKNITRSPSPMTASHDASSKPSILLVLVCLAVVHRLRPGWISVKLEQAARSENLSPQRLSRLCSGAIGPFQGSLNILTRIGRPSPEKHGDSAVRHNALLRALLSVATAILQHVSLGKPAIRALVVGAYLRLKQAHPELTKERFCQTLALSPRTFRYWMAHRTQTPSIAPVSPPPEKKPPKKRPHRRPRFGFDVVLPDTQIAADTTDLQAFGVPLKLVAAQDIGGRDQDLFDSVIVDDRESSDHVIRAITCALDEKEGQQVLTDQGTPYMAQATETAIERLGAEHAPQKEADPLGKATIERAFGTAKHIAAPIFDLTSKIAQKLPSLRDPRLAKAAATLLLTALLKAYQAGARAARRADDQRSSISAELLDELAKKSRDNARADYRSARLLLEHIHRDYDIKRPLPLFLKQMRRFPLPVLKQTERAFAGQVHRDDIKDRASYFAAIARRCNEEHRRKLEIARRAREEDRRLRREIQNVHAARNARLADPAAWLSEALCMLAAQWIPQSGALLLAGAGLGKRSLLDALDRLVEMNGHFDAQDIAQGVFANFETADPCGIGSQGLQAVRSLFETALGEKLKKQSYCRPSFAAAILRNNGP